MIQIILSDKSYDNDVFPIVKSFYPEKMIKVYDRSEKERISAEMDKDKCTLNFIEADFTDSKISLLVKMSDKPALSRTADVENIKKLRYKNTLKRLLYQMLSEITGRSLPWGILTGIRPVKLVYEMLEEEKTKDAIKMHLEEEYLCSDEKIAMSLAIAKREREILRDINYKEGYSIYIGIPFCPSTCLYCSFPSYSITRFQDYVDRYLDALEKEIIVAGSLFPDKQLTSVYIGGGTPTSLSAGQLHRLLSIIQNNLNFNSVKEFCVEAGRPDSITKDKLLVLKELNVGRISINPQSMQQRTLDLIGRKHTVEQIQDAFRMARETGHDNINMDIIIGLPGETPEDVKDTLMKIKMLNPESLTVHTLALKRAARLNIEKGNYTDIKAVDVPAMQQATIKFAGDNNYLPYYLYRQKNMTENLENIGYSRYGKEGIYNILIMEEKQTILALGAGGMSKFVFHEENRIERVENVKSVTDYVNRIDEMIQRKLDFLRLNSL